MLMTIRLSEIKASTPRVRLSQSTEKLQELADSIREEGLIVPVKVRKNGTGYTLVYGHRRVAAAQMAGLKEIEAIVANVPDEKLLTHALVENVVREDMAPIDIAKAFRKILDETGCTQEQLARKVGWATQGNVARYLFMLEPELGLLTSKKYLAPNIGPDDVWEARAGTGGDLNLAQKVLVKAAKDDLSQRQTRQVAEVVRRASDFGGKKAVDRVLARPSAEILRTAETLPTRKPKPLVREVKGKVKFQWIKDARVILAEESLRALSAVVAAIARSDEDKPGGRIVLKDLRNRLRVVLKQMDEVLGQR